MLISKQLNAWRKSSMEMRKVEDMQGLADALDTCVNQSMVELQFILPQLEQSALLWLDSLQSAGREHREIMAMLKEIDYKGEKL
jgi:hypothetical protein